MDPDDLGKHLERRREAAGMTRLELADAIRERKGSAFSTARVLTWERGIALCTVADYLMALELTGTETLFRQKLPEPDPPPKPAPKRHHLEDFAKAGPPARRPTGVISAK